MANTLPDEILSEILSPALKVPECKFSDTSLKSPFATYSGGESSSAALLVSKAWLRVSTPLLYDVVIIRSKAQAGALATALQGPQNLGRFVKKLRVEGGFGSHMHHILKSTPNVTDIFLSAMIHAPDTTSGLVLGLPLINPTRLIFFENPKNLLKNKWVLQLLGVLEVGICKNWTNLTTVVLSHDSFNGAARQNFEDALCSSKTVKIVSVARSSIRLLNKIAKIPSLQAIEMRATPRALGTPYVNAITAEPLLKPLVRFSEPETKIQAPLIQAIAANPAFRPMSSSPQSVIDDVWKHVLFFAMVVDECILVAFKSMEEHFHAQKINRRRLCFLLVSKTFNRLGLPYLYRYPVLWDDRMCLTKNPSHGSRVREMHRLEAISFGFGEQRQIPDFAPILSRTSQLTRLIADRGRYPLSWGAFEALAETAGNTLLEFTGFFMDQAVPVLSQPAVFVHFTVLRSLEWDCSTVFPPESLASVPSATLPALEFLKVKSPGIFPVLEQLELPSLRCLVLSSITGGDCTEFLRRHGPKLTDLELSNWAMEGLSPSVFELCPSVSRLELYLFSRQRDNVYPPLLVFPSKHQSLVQLVVRKNPSAKKNGDAEEWGHFLEGSAWADFPALREIRPMPFSWPTDERAISRSPWVKWAEGLLSKNIKLTDEDGKHWKPRFKGTGR